MKEDFCKKCKAKIKINKRTQLGITFCFTCKHKCKICGSLLTKKKSELCRKCLSKDKEYRIRLSKSVKGKAGGYREGSGISKKVYYKGVCFDSPFEFEVAVFLDENKINWVRNTKRFYFEWKGTKTYYIPDFYLIDQDRYIEIKGYWRKDAEVKFIEFKKQ